MQGELNNTRTELATTQGQLETTRLELDAERGAKRAERAARHQSALLLRNVSESVGMNSVLLQLRGGNGGRTGQSVYTAPNGVVVTSSKPTCKNSNYYYIEYLFSGTQTGSHTDYWLVKPVGATKKATLTFAVPNPISLGSIRMHTHGVHNDRGITEFTLTLTCGSETLNPITHDAPPRGQWIDIPIDHAGVTSFAFDLVTTTTYLSVNSIEVYVNPQQALSTAIDGLLPFLTHDLDDGGVGSSS